MVDSSRRRGRRREVMSSHNRCWIWGRNVVRETLRAGRWPILELLVSDDLEDKLLNEVQRMSDRKGVELVAVSDAELTKSCRTGEHQGLAARMAPFPYQVVDEFLPTLPDDAVVVVLDRLQDPFNFGAIIRSASTLDVSGLVIGDHGQVDVNSQVARSSVGAVNHLPIARTDDLGRVVDRLREHKYQVVAASEKSRMPLFEADFRRPTVMIIGNEGSGISSELLSRCDVSVSIPMSGRVGSLNAAVAAGILFYEMRRQRITTK